jgi:hypothetical protein
MEIGTAEVNFGIVAGPIALDRKNREGEDKDRETACGAQCPKSGVPGGQAQQEDPDQDGSDDPKNLEREIEIRSRSKLGRLRAADRLRNVFLWVIVGHVKCSATQQTRNRRSLSEDVIVVVAMKTLNDSLSRHGDLNG